MSFRCLLAFVCVLPSLLLPTALWLPFWVLILLLGPSIWHLLRAQSHLALSPVHPASLSWEWSVEECGGLAHGLVDGYGYCVNTEEEGCIPKEEWVVLPIQHGVGVRVRDRMLRACAMC